MGRRGELSSKTSKATIRHLEGQVEATRLLGHQVQLMQSITRSPLTAGNKVTLLINGKATYAAMFQAITNAKESINFETFIFDDDKIGKKFCDLLIKKSLEGVRVNVIYDSYGSHNTPARFFDRMRHNSIQVLEFNPLDPTRVRRGMGWSLLHRDHQKILVVDGAIAITGGVNISAVYSASPSGGLRRAKKRIAWRDTDVEIKGPAAAQFQKLFLNTWKRQHGPALPAANYFPHVGKAGNCLVRVVESLPGEKNRLIFIMYIAAITNSENSVYLTTPYFVPDYQMMKALTDAAARGVDVKILLPGISDEAMVLYASRYYYARLLRAGVQLFEWRGGILHAKTAVIDDVWSTVGSSNLDNESLLTNDEANAVILGRPFADKMQAMFEKDLEDSDPISLDAWENRSFGERIKEWTAHLFKHLL
jgi:cardiolipin synthase